MNSKHFPLIVCLSSAMWLNSHAQSTNNPPFSAIYAFGDCLTDTHNVEPPPFPSWNGRYSNGPMWIEDISTNLGLAYRAANNLAFNAFSTAQVLSRVGSFSAPSSASNTLFVVWGGPVDFYAYLGPEINHGIFTSPTNDVAWNGMIAQGVGNLSNCVAKLYAKGARSVLVPNVDDVSRQPVVITWLSEETRSGVRQRVKQFNAALAQALASLDQAYPDLRVISPDAFGLFTDFLDNATNFGMTVTYPAAMQDDGLVNRSFTGPGADYVFWDQYGHPTAKAHAFIAANFLSALTSARPERLSAATTGDSPALNLSKLLIGRNYTVQSSEDLANWRNVYSFTAAAGTNQWNDATSGGSSRFYRLIWNQ